MPHYTGFVLKSYYPVKQKLSLLSDTLGKIDAFSQRQHQYQQLRPGMLILFFYDNASALQNCIKIENIEILYSPQPLTHQNIQWLHHLLELCFYFTAYNDPCIQAFSCLKDSINFLNSPLFYSPFDILIKKLCVIKLLSLTGFADFMPVQKEIALFNSLTTSFIDFTNEQKLESLKKHAHAINNQEIDHWIVKQIKKHPQVQQFKTI